MLFFIIRPWLQPALGCPLHAVCLPCSMSVLVSFLLPWWMPPPNKQTNKRSGFILIHISRGLEFMSGKAWHGSRKSDDHTSAYKQEVRWGYTPPQSLYPRGGIYSIKTVHSKGFITSLNIITNYLHLKECSNIWACGGYYFLQTIVRADYKLGATVFKTWRKEYSEMLRGSLQVTGHTDR